jgi:hypothetical protein
LAGGELVASDLLPFSRRSPLHVQHDRFALLHLRCGGRSNQFNGLWRLEHEHGRCALLASGNDRDGRNPAGRNNEKRKYGSHDDGLCPPLEPMKSY